MEHIPQIIKAMADYGISPVMFLFFGMFYMMGVQNGTFPKIWGDKTKQENVPPWAQHLLQHFNEDITDHQKEIRDKIYALIQMEKDEHEQNAEIRENVRELKNTLSNFEKYGLKSR